MRSLFKSLRTAIFVCAFASMVHYFVNNKNFTIAVKDIKTIGAKYAGQNPSTSLQQILHDFRRLYADHMIPTAETNWFTLGGALSVKVYLLHVSLTEYLAVVGSPIRTSGHTGFHWMNQSCTVLVGSVQRSKDGFQLSRDKAGPGDHVRLAMFENSVVELAEDTWALCYGRGVVPASVPYLSLNFATSSVDPLTPARMLFTSSRALGREIYQWAQETYAFYMHKFTGKQ